VDGDPFEDDVFGSGFDFESDQRGFVLREHDGVVFALDRCSRIHPVERHCWFPILDPEFGCLPRRVYREDAIDGTGRFGVQIRHFDGQLAGTVERRVPLSIVRLRRAEVDSTGRLVATGKRAGSNDCAEGNYRRGDEQ